MDQKRITSTEFQNHAGQYIDEAGREPVFITRYDRPVRVLIDIQEYERLKSFDTREYYDLRTDKLPDDLLAELEKGYQGKEDTELDRLME